MHFAPKAVRLASYTDHAPVRSPGCLYAAYQGLAAWRTEGIRHGPLAGLSRLAPPHGEGSGARRTARARWLSLPPALPMVSHPSACGVSDSLPPNTMASLKKGSLSWRGSPPEMTAGGLEHQALQVVEPLPGVLGERLPAYVAPHLEHGPSPTGCAPPRTCCGAWPAPDRAPGAPARSREPRSGAPRRCARAPHAADRGFRPLTPGGSSQPPPRRK